MYQVKTPVVFIIFNRPDQAREIYSAIAKARPKKLLVIADGPRSNVVGEKELCEETRQIIESVNWDCEVLENYSDVNLGCRERLASGLDWAFENVPEAIILEDDCLPDPSFFQFCDELLEKYRDDDRVGMISGDNFQNGIERGDGDYYFSQFCHIWGWASWARAWKKYDVNLAQWPELKAKDWLGSLGFTGAEKIFWQKKFDRVHSKEQDTWDYQWTFACWFHKMLAVMPNTNLISNIGFGPQATHTTSDSIYANMTRFPMHFPLRHPSDLIQNIDADHYTSQHMFSSSLWRRIFGKLKACLGVRL